MATVPTELVRKGGVIAEPPAVLDGSKLLVLYVLYELSCQLLLLSPALAPIRVVLRSAAFGGSLALVIMLKGKATTWHPARSALTVAMAILAISALNPAGAGPLASLAQFCLHLSIVGPIFWIARLRVTEQTLERVLAILWIYYTISACFGVLQMYFPGRFEPPVIDMIRARGPIYEAAMKIQLASGETVFRPMGLSDSPGGASTAGFYAALLGIGFTQTRPVFWGSRWVAVASVLVGIMVLYLSHVRSLVVAFGLSFMALVALFGVSARFARFIIAGGVIGGLAIIGYAYAKDVGGDAMVQRLATLVEDDPTSVYYANRGHFLEHTFLNLLPEYPLGAGLGRWGMTNAYFAPPGTLIWVEIQWSGWLLDGGIILCIAFAAAVALGIMTAARIALSWRTGAIGLWAAVLAAYAVGLGALTFNSTPFAGTTGLEFWFMVAVLFQAAYGPGGPLGAK